MPIYEYKCSNGHSFEAIQKMADDPLTECEQCGAPVERVFHPVAVHFKGSGFYTTDYGSKSKSKSSDSDGDSKSSSGESKSSGGDSKSSSGESKSTGGESKSSGGSGSGSGGSENTTKSSSGGD